MLFDPKHFSYKKKLTLLVTAAILLPLIIASGVLGVMLKRQAESIYFNRLQASLQVFSLMIHDKDQKLFHSVQKASTDNTLQVTLDLEIISQLTNYLASQLRALDLYSLGVADTQRKLLVQEGKQVVFDLSREGSQIIIDGDSVLMGHVAPVMRGDKSLGYVAGAIELTSQKFFLQLSEALEDNFVIWINDKPVLTDLMFNRAMISPDRLVESKISDLQISGVDFKALSRSVSYGDIPITLSVVVPKTELTKAFHNTIIIIALLVVVLYLIILSALHLVIKGLATPVQQLTKASEQLEKGDYELHELDLERRDEFGALNRTFKNMAAVVHRQIEMMEERVRARTNELAVANTALMNDMILREQNEKEKTHLEEQLFQARRLESIGLLAGGIAHDFNNFLTGIVNSITLAKLHLKPEDKAFQILAKSEQATAKASSLTQQLLTFSKGGAPIKSSAAIINLIKESTGFVLRGSNVKPDYDLPGDLWTIDADEGQISQVIHNLVLNGDQAMGEGGIINIRGENVEISSSAGLPLTPGRYVKIYFEDHGIGIPQQNIVKIFDPYFTTKKSGTGLGLATSYSIIKNHSGLITAESEEGKGSTFTIYLPVSDRNSGRKKIPETNSLPGGLKILFMDDDDTIRDTLPNSLEYLNYEVESASDGKEAVALYEKAMNNGKPFDVVVLDLTIPGGMGGRETIAELLAIDPGVTAIVSSGYSEDPIMADYKKYGFKGVVPKPYRVEKLCQLMHILTG